MGEKLTVVDGKQYREVSRRANDGELIKVTREDSDYYSEGNVGRVKRAGSDDVYTDFNGFGNSGYDRSCDGVWYVGHQEYVVLEPLTVANDLRALVDGLTQSVASLTLRVTELERKAPPAKLSIGDMTVKVSVDASDIKAFAESLRKKTRDDIVEQAKKDVAELIIKAKSTRMDTPSTSRYGSLDVEFVVNRDKRTVVALLRDHWTGSRKVRVDGKSRCAPDDCFNAHIGRAIALRRALGLTVPTEYYEAPQPTEFNTGDVVKAKRYYTKWTATLTERNEFYDDCLCGDAWNHTHDSGWVGEDQIVVIDDSREEVSV